MINYYLERFDYKKDMPPGMAGISKLDASHISFAHFALVADNPNGGYESEINLLLMALRVYGQANAFIKWRFCKELPTKSTSIPSDQRFRRLAIASSRRVEESTLTMVREGFLNILEMNQVSDRTKIALYFVWRGLCSPKHIDAYIFLVCAIEALFSNDTPDDATKILIKRTQKFLSGFKGCGGDQIKKIYKIRSDMVHGRVPHTEKDSEDALKNIQNLATLELLLFNCLRKMLDKKLYLHYQTNKKREIFLNDLMK